jgi:RNA polymerase sigma-70 factor (ECF subfamily)
LHVGYRTIINLYAVEGFTHKQIAESLGIAEGTSKSQLAKARIQLKKLLDKIKVHADAR